MLQQLQITPVMLGVICLPFSAGTVHRLLRPLLLLLAGERRQCRQLFTQHRQPRLPLRLLVTQLAGDEEQCQQQRHYLQQQHTQPEIGAPPIAALARGRKLT